MNQQGNIKQQGDQQQMQNSTGFRTKLRLSQSGFRPSSRDGTKAKIGEIFPNVSEITSQYTLQLVNLFQDENTLCSQLKLELVQMQEEINRLDIDGKLRGPDRNELSKPHIRQLKSWLSQYSNPNIKSIIDSKMNQTIDLPKLLETLNCKNPQDGVVKLYKLLVLIEVMFIKQTELEAIHMLQYEDTYNQLCRMDQFGQTFTSEKLEKLSQQGVILNKFIVQMANIERSTEFIQSASKLKQNVLSSLSQIPQNMSVPQQIEGVQELEARIKKLMQENQQNLKVSKQRETEYLKDSQVKDQKIHEQNQQITSLIQKITNLESQVMDFTVSKGKIQVDKKFEDANKSLNDNNKNLVHQVKQLEDDKQQLQVEIGKIKRQYMDMEEKFSQKASSARQSISIPEGSTVNTSAYEKIIDDQKKDYELKIKKINEENGNLRTQTIELQIKIDSIKSQLIQLDQEVNQLKQRNDDLYRQFAFKYMSKDEYADSYEQAMKFEFDKMKESYQKRVDQLQKDNEQLKKEVLRTQNELKRDLEKEQETKKLLMNKLNMYMQQQ